MKLYIVRHGESIANAQERIQGRKNYPLSERGIAQARQLAQWASTQQIDLIYTSPAKRTMETADIVGEATQIPIESDERLQPMDLGILEDQLPGELDSDLLTTWNRVKAMENIHAHGGESIHDVIERVHPFLHDITIHHEQHTICVITHNMVKRALVKHLLNIPETELQFLRFPNTAVSLFEIRGTEVIATQLHVPIDRP